VSPGAAAKPPEQSKNHVFCFAILSLKTERVRSFRAFCHGKYLSDKML
jgi:hypothetical protein